MNYVKAFNFPINYYIKAYCFPNLERKNRKNLEGK